MMDDKKQKKEKQICGVGVHCLKLEDKEHSTKFIHLNPVNFSFLSLSLTSSFYLFSFLIVDKLIFYY
jgi:hypothetical protein